MGAAAILLLAGLAAGPARAEPATVSSSTVSLSTAPFIGEITLHSLNVFDPAVKGEDWWPFQWANRIHVMTRESVVRRELLLGPGDRWNPLRALESERNLRSLGLFRYAEIDPKQRPDGKLDLSVRTQDSWTLSPEFSIGTEGGTNYLSYGVTEDNLLGYGKSVGVQHSQVGSIRRSDFRYDDARFMGSRYRLSPFYGRTTNGDSVGTDLIKPFFSLDSPSAMSLSWSRTIDETLLYKDAEQSNGFLQRSQVVSASYGSRLESDRWFVQRVEAGWYAQKDEFNPNADTLQPIPINRELSGPTVGYSWIQPHYIKETYINRMERVEDFNMGNEFQVLGGFMSQLAGSDRDRWMYNAIDQQGLRIGPGRFALAQVGAEGRMAGGHAENALLYANLNLFWKQELLFPQTWVTHLEVNKGRNLDRENQILLGGSNGLRGYKTYSFAGDESILWNLEDRFFFPGEYFHLMRWGGAVFFDSGAVAPPGVGVTWGSFRSDLGAGLRFSSTRSQSGSILRADVAYALNRGPEGPRWVVSIRGSQAFEIFNSSTRRVRESPTSRLYSQPSN